MTSNEHQDTESAARLYRALFPVTDECIYMDAASQGPVPMPVAESIVRHLQQALVQGSDAYPLWEDQCNRVRSSLADLIGATSRELAFAPNTPTAISFVANGLTWYRGDEVIVPDQEFSANVFPWKRLAEFGVTLTTIPSSAGRVPIVRIEEAMSRNTRVIAISWVQFSTGYRSDLALLAQLCREYECYLCVDAAQGVGALGLNVHDLDVDFLAAPSHKWLLGPMSVGWLYCRAALLDELKPTVVGQLSYERPRDGSWLGSDLSLWSDARRFEAGIPNHIAIAGLEAALQLMKEVGLGQIERQIKYMVDSLAQELIDRGFILGAPRDHEQWSGIVSFDSDHHSATDIHRQLSEANVLCSLREGLVRLSPHFYNNESDVERVLDALPKN